MNDYTEELVRHSPDDDFIMLDYWEETYYHGNWCVLNIVAIIIFESFCMTIIALYPSSQQITCITYNNIVIVIYYL